MLQVTVPPDLFSPTVKSQRLQASFQTDFLASFSAVVITLILLTVAALAFLLYRYLCHNKGDYRTTGELAPGEDPEVEYADQGPREKKEYFI